MKTDPYNAILNNGERLIPGESHDLAEVVRHKSSYRFFSAVIAADLKQNSEVDMQILDLGCGVGHGSHTLSKLPNARITAIDPSRESIEYARTNYTAPNITYINADAEGFLALGQSFDYIVSRHALEHIDNGIEVARRYNFSRRLMINVPYKEPEGNIYHRVHFITENSFSGYQGAEFFFEDMEGVTETSPDKLDYANSIICILTNNDAPKVSDILMFPFGAWQPSLQARLFIETAASVKQLQARVAQLNDKCQLLENNQMNFVTQKQFEDHISQFRSTLMLRVLRKLGLVN